MGTSDSVCVRVHERAPAAKGVGRESCGPAGRLSWSTAVCLGLALLECQTWGTLAQSGVSGLTD